MAGLIAMLASTGLVSTGYAAENNMSRTKLAINKNGVKVWTYQTPDNPAFTYRATTVLNTSLSSTVAVITDTKSLTQWVPYVSHIDVIERDADERNFILHM
ncbi:hypothetical protein RJJ65_39710, partial [Rhizobium hidalgonense]